MSERKALMEELGLIWAMGVTVTFLYIFLTAYFSPSKTVIVDINRWGEANIEAGLLLIVVPTIFYACIKNLKK